MYPNAEMLLCLFRFRLKQGLFPISIIVSLYLGFSGSGGELPISHILGRFSWIYFDKIWGRNRYRIN